MCNDDTLSYKLEALRAYVERAIGFEQFYNIYSGVKQDEPGLEDAARDTQYSQLIHQLIYLEDKVFENRNYLTKVAQDNTKQIDFHN